MSTRHLVFIVNPISGGKSKHGFKTLVEAQLDKDKYHYTIIEAAYPQHACAIVDENAMHADAFVAVGGDGTINEVAQQASHHKIPMGIVPMGSGNGLARHLGIPLKAPQAIAALNQAHVAAIDTATLNQHFFVSLAGVGFDSLIARDFSQSKSRGFVNYARIGLKTYFKYKPQTYQLMIDGKAIEREAFMITVANSNQFGYNTKISPMASLQDGLLDVCILRKPAMWQSPAVMLKFWNDTAHTSSFLEIIQAKQLHISPNPSGYANVDGETIEVGQQVEIRLQENKLNILLPKEIHNV